MENPEFEIVEPEFLFNEGNIDYLTELLTPEYGGKKVTYNEYIEN